MFCNASETKNGESIISLSERAHLHREVVALLIEAREDIEAFHAMQSTFVPRHRVQPVRLKMEQSKKKARNLHDDLRHIQDDDEMSSRADELGFLRTELQQALQQPDRGPVIAPEIDARLQRAISDRNHEQLEDIVNTADREINTGKIVVPPSLPQARKMLQDMDRAASHIYVGPKYTRQIEDFFRGRPTLDTDANYHRKNSELK